MKTGQEVSHETALSEQIYIPFEKPKETFFNYGMSMLKQGKHNHIYFIGHSVVDMKL